MLSFFLIHHHWYHYFLADFHNSRLHLHHRSLQQTGIQGIGWEKLRRNQRRRVWSCKLYLVCELNVAATRSWTHPKVRSWQGSRNGLLVLRIDSDFDVHCQSCCFLCKWVKFRSNLIQQCNIRLKYLIIDIRENDYGSGVRSVFVPWYVFYINLYCQYDSFLHKT